MAPKPVSDVTQLTRGTAAIPDETSWDCIQRLATDVQWFAFSNGNTLYYMDGPDLAAQMPLCAIGIDTTQGIWALTDNATGAQSFGVVNSLSFTFDDTAFTFKTTRTVKGKVQHQALIATPTTPTEIQLNLICDIDYVRGGDVITFQNSGPINGRWIVTDCTRNCLGDTFSQLTLGPPTAPFAEPQASTNPFRVGGKKKAPTGSNPVPDPTAPKDSKQIDPTITRDANGVAAAALKALSEKSKYIYQEQLDPARSNSTTDLFGPAPRVMDCSKFVTLCFKAAGLRNPSGGSYNAIGNTNTIIANCFQVTTPRVGDLCFFGASSKATTHVTVYVGNGKAVSMGMQGDPEEGPAPTTGPSGFIGYFRVHFNTAAIG